MNLLLFESPSGRVYPVLEFPPRTATWTQQEPAEPDSLREKIYRGYQKLEERVAYHERLCSTLRHVDHLRILHGCELEQAEIERRLATFFAQARRKHSRWLVVDITLALLGSLLTPIPGPNVFFLYPALRAYGHYCACKGVTNYRKLGMIQFETDALIDQVQNQIDQPEAIQPVIKQLEDRYNLVDLEERLTALRMQ